MKFTSAIAVLAAGLLLLTAAHAAPDTPERSLTVFFTGFVEGNFGPCGCETEPNGGLARRAGYAAQFLQDSSGPALHIDLGNYFKPLGPDSRTVNQLMLESLRKLPVSVLNLAPGDLFLWKQLSRADLPGTKVISTNLSPLDASLKAPAKHAVLEVQAGDSTVRVGFLGVSDPARVKPNSRLKAQDPAKAVAEAIERLRGQADFFIVLADIPRNNGPLAKDLPLHQIAAANPEVYAVLSTEKRYLLHRTEQINNAVILSSVERGRHLGSLTFFFGEQGEVTAVKPEFVNMNAGVPEDPEFLRAQRELESRLR